MECVSEYLASQDEPVSRASIERSVSGKAEYVRQAIGALVEEGYARETEGKGGAKPIEFVRFYREADDDFEGPEGDEPTSSRPRPEPPVDPHPRPRPPYRGRGRGRGSTSSLYLVPAGC
jgi:hypothetical protein